VVTEHPPLSGDAASEHLVAVLTLWGVAGGFGLAMILSGFHGGDAVLGLAGFAVIIAGFVAHVLVNNAWRTRFSALQTVTGMAGFCVAVLSYVAGWLFGPGYAGPDVQIGLGGFAAIVIAYLIYVFTMFGIGGAFSKLNRRRRRAD